MDLSLKMLKEGEKEEEISPLLRLELEPWCRGACSVRWRGQRGRGRGRGRRGQEGSPSHLGQITDEEEGEEDQGSEYETTLHKSLSRITR